MSEYVMVKRDLQERILGYSWFPEGNTQNGIDRRFFDREELRAVLAQEAGKFEPVALSVPDECPHLIVFDDTDRENLLFAGAGSRSAALKTWEKISQSWNAHLFVRVERNSRDDRYPSAHTSPPAPVSVVLSFEFEHPSSKEKRTVTLTKRDVFDGMEDYFYDKIGEQICQCESVGETNVIDCNCDEYVHDFEIVNACLDANAALNAPK